MRGAPGRASFLARHPRDGTEPLKVGDRVQIVPECQDKEPGPKEILEAMTRTIPLANLMDGQISALRHWAKGRAREAASRITPTRNGSRIAEAN